MGSVYILNPRLKDLESTSQAAESILPTRVEMAKPFQSRISFKKYSEPLNCFKISFQILSVQHSKEKNVI